MKKCVECGRTIEDCDITGDLCEECYNEEYGKWFGGASQNEDGEYDV